MTKHFGINKIKELISQKYYCPIFSRDVKAYAKGYNVYIASKAIRYKFYTNL